MQTAIYDKRILREGGRWVSTASFECEPDLIQLRSGLPISFKILQPRIVEVIDDLLDWLIDPFGLIIGMERIANAS